jgi:hypothetical protein
MYIENDPLSSIHTSIHPSILHGWIPTSNLLLNMGGLITLVISFHSFTTGKYSSGLVLWQRFYCN